jgi:glycosyltransferase involved in cell wall biosynthesis
VKSAFEQAGATPRLHLTEVLAGRDLVDAYHAMDVFAFASQSETQGIVLIEAMAAGVPVVGVDACGVRDVVSDVNGRLLPSEDEASFAAALASLAAPDVRRACAEAARRTAGEFTREKCANRALEIYRRLVDVERFRRRETDESSWAQTIRRMKAEWDLMKTFTKATTDAIRKEGDPSSPSNEGA